jgi:hypothetical protein
MVVGATTAAAGTFTTLIASTSFGAPFVSITGGSITGGNQMYIGGGVPIANVAAVTGYFTNLSTSNLLVTTENVTTSHATNFSTGNATIQGSGTYIGTGATPIANVYASLGEFTNLSSANIIGGFYGTVYGITATANVAYYDVVTPLTTNGTFYPTFSNLSTAGNSVTGVNSSLTFNPSTGALSATSFNGVGTFTTATTSSTFISSGNVVAAAATTSTTTTTGALVVPNGGVGVSGNAVVGGQVQAGLGLYSVGSFNGGYSDGIVVDYATNNGRISVGAGDALTFYSGGPASTQTAQLSSAGVLTVAGNVVAASATTTTSATTGAIVVPGTGGVGIGGNLYVNGLSTHVGNVTISNATIFNTTQTAGSDTIIRGANDSTLLWARSGTVYDQVLIGNSATAGSLVRGSKLTINSTDSMLIPVGTTAQRPGLTGGTDTTGMMRYNTTTGGLEFFTGAVWSSPGTAFTVIVDQQFNGDGSTVNFTLSQSQTSAGVIVSINGVMQIPTLAYSVTGTTLTFTEAPANGDIIDVRELTTTQTVTVSGLASVNTFMGVSSDNNGVYIDTSTTTPGQATTYWNTAGAQVSNIANVTVGYTGGAATLDSFLANTYSTAKYIVTSTISGTTIREVAEILVVTDGVNADNVVYGVVSTAGNTMTTWTSNVVSGNVTLYATPTNPNQIYRIKKDYLAV